jgi:opacity protein-like surface antigen
MISTQSVGTVAVAFTWLLVSVHPAAAEWFTDLYGGGSLTESSRFSLDGNIDGAPVAGLISNVKFEKSFTVGGRVGYWFESLTFFGVGLDAWHFRPDISPQTGMGKGTINDSRGALFGVPISVNGAGPVRLPEVDFRVTAVAPELLLRWPMLVSTDFPHGQFQPYLTVGPALYIVDLEGFHPSKFHPKTSIGVTGGGGLAWQFTKHIGVFAEYRYTNTRPSLESGDIVFKTHLSTHHLLGGISFRY